jgi:hypothetical protein
MSCALFCKVLKTRWLAGALCACKGRGCERGSFLGPRTTYPSPPFAKRANKRVGTTQKISIARRGYVVNNGTSIRNDIHCAGGMCRIPGGLRARGASIRELGKGAACAMQGVSHRSRPLRAIMPALVLTGMICYGLVELERLARAIDVEAKARGEEEGA